MLPEHFYFTGAGWLGYVFYVPLALGLVGLLYAFVVRKIPIKIIRWPVLVILVIASLTAPLWQALSISYQAEKLCKEQGGLHVYRTVEADGFLGGWGIETAAKYGFSYVESGGGKHMNRWTMVNGNPVRESISEYKSRYQIQTGADPRKIGNKFRRSSTQVIDRETGEVLSEQVTIGIYPSYFDRLMLNLQLVDYNSWQCGNKKPIGNGKDTPVDETHIYSISDVIRATMRSKNKKAGIVQ